MKISIRTKFSIGILFFFVIIAVITGVSAFYLNKLSDKTSMIMKENHLSVIYARDMSEGIMSINQEVSNSHLTNRNPDSALINRGINIFSASLKLEKNNITETGEANLVTSIEKGFNQYRDSLAAFNGTPEPVTKLLYLQKQFSSLYQQLAFLSRINEKAIEFKTEDAKVSAKNALKQMSFLGTLCFLIALSFTYNFASYFSGRFFQLYNGIKELVSSNYGQRLHFEGKDEFYDISLVFNEMAEKLNENKQKMDLTLQVDKELYDSIEDVKELKKLLERINSIEEQATGLISRLENKK
jgi:methyl-accepting chemotaxis protein